MIKKIYDITVFIFILCFGIFIFSLFRHFDPDLWGHLRFGKYILEQGIPYHDVFSFLVTKQIWVNHEWLSEVIFYLFYLLNPNGFCLLLFKSLLCTSIFGLAFYRISTQKSLDFKVLLFIIAISMLAFTYGSAIRPQIFTYFYFAILLFILDKYKTDSLMSYISIPILFILWVNCHGGVVAGFIITFIYGLYQVIFINKDKYTSIIKYKPLLLPLLLTIIPIITPYGIAYYPYIIDAIMMKRPYIEEWSPLFTSKINYLYTYILILTSVILVITGIKNINRYNIINLVVLILTFIMSLMHARHIPFFAIACAFYLPYFLEEKSYTHVSTNNISIKYLIGPFIVIFLSVYFLKNTFLNEKISDYSLKIDQVTSSQNTGFPVNTVIFIKNNSLKGKLLTGFNWGEFIIFFLYPQVKVSVDGRYETVYFNSTVEQNFAIINAQRNWKQLLLKMDPNLILVSKFEPLAKELPSLPNYKLVFNDIEAQLYIKNPISNR